MQSLAAATATATALAALAALAAPTVAHAGRTHHGFLYGTEVVPERGVEVESWLTEENQKGDDDLDETNWLWGATVGITDRLELALPLEIVWTRSDATPDARFTIAQYGAELRWRLVSSDPVDAPPFVPLVRVAAKRITGDREAARLEADVVASYQVDRFHAVVDVGVTGVVRKGEDVYEVHPGVGASYAVLPDLRVGAEAYAEIALVGDGVDWVAAGPSLGWTHGRFWLSATAGIGLHNIQSAPRLKLGVAF